MGYHGYEIWFCSNGHAHTYDVWDTLEINSNKWTCPICQDLLFAISSVDITNATADWNTEGCAEKYDCGWYDLEEYLLREDIDVCKHCGSLLEHAQIFDVAKILQEGHARRVTLMEESETQDSSACWMPIDVEGTSA